jgi:prepilin-type N-terminal cleavage/methylation domain-containing protein
MRARNRRASNARGFTLVELLLATTAGLIVSAAAFLLAKNASAVFQEETRITSAQLSASLGLQRLTSDIARAGFLTTPNSQTDPFVCKEPGTWPPLIANLRAISIEEAGSVTAHPADLTQSTANGFSPDRITIAGSFDSAEMFPVGSIEDGGGGKSVYLQESMPVKRLCKEKTLAQCELDLKRIFKHDRILQITTTTGNLIYGLIDQLSVTDKIKIALQATPSVPTVASNPRGYSGDCVGCLVNTVSVVRYELQSLQGNAQYGMLVAPFSANATGDAGRTELTRVELDKDGNPMIDDTLELVSEFAVDLKFGVSTVDAATTAVTDLPITEPANPLVYAAPPERIRSVHVRFSTRGRAPDRDFDLPHGPDGRRHRFKLPIAGKVNYARMRTLYTEVGLQNMVRNTW